MFIKIIKRQIIPLFRNFFSATGILLLVWMFFFDANDFISQYKLTKKYEDLQRERQYYINKIEEVKLEQSEVFGSQFLVEKFAREKYLMKKPTEDIYIITKE
jgi:cell division protein DivIC